MAGDDASVIVTIAAPPRDRETIRFYSTQDAYGEFSNFARYSIMLDGKLWPT